MLSILFAAAVSSANPSAKQILEQVFAAFNRHDANGIAALYADDAILISPDFCGQKVGPGAVRDNYSGYFKSMSDAHDHVVNLVGEGDTAAVEFVFTGTANGHKVELPIASFITVKNGKIIRDVTYFDVDPSPTCPATSQPTK